MEAVAPRGIAGDSMEFSLEKRINWEMALMPIGAAIFGYLSYGSEVAGLVGTAVFLMAARGTRWVQLAEGKFRVASDLGSVVRSAAPASQAILPQEASPSAIIRAADLCHDVSQPGDLPKDVWMRLDLGLCTARGGLLVEEYFSEIQLTRAERTVVVDAIKLRCAWSIGTCDLLHGRVEERDTVCMLLNLAHLERPITSLRNPYGQGTLENPYPVRSPDEAVDWLQSAWSECPIIEEKALGKTAEIHTFKVVLGPGEYGVSVNFRYIE